MKTLQDVGLKACSVGGCERYLNKISRTELPFVLIRLPAVQNPRCGQSYQCTTWAIGSFKWLVGHGWLWPCRSFRTQLTPSAIPRKTSEDQACMQPNLTFSAFSRNLRTDQLPGKCSENCTLQGICGRKTGAMCQKMDAFSARSQTLPLLQGPQYLVWMLTFLACLWVFNFGAVLTWQTSLYYWHRQTAFDDQEL